MCFLINHQKKLASGRAGRIFETFFSRPFPNQPSALFRASPANISIFYGYFTASNRIDFLPDGKLQVRFFYVQSHWVISLQRD